MRNLMLLLLLAMIPQMSPTAGAKTAPDVTVLQATEDFTLSNGIIEAVVSRTNGQLRSIRDLTIEGQPSLANSLYWDANAELQSPPPDAKPPKKGYFRGAPSEVAVLHNTPERAEVVVRVDRATYFQFDVEYHFVLLRGTSGLYAYVVFNHASEYDAARLWQTRFVLRTAGTDVFQAWSTGSDNLVPIPSAATVATLTDATFLLADGTVKTKYQNSVYWSESPVYGVIGTRLDKSALGVWMIEASPEYHNGGPVKQGQTVHDNVLLRVLQSVHFGAAPVDVAKGEQWQKVYGPFLLYVNHADNVTSLWQDAKRQHQAEVAAWPYQWVDDKNFAQERGSVRGQVQLSGGSAAGARVILSDPDVEWTQQSKGYSFWTRADADGRFVIPKVRPGTYTLHIAGADEPVDFVKKNVSVEANQQLDLGAIAWAPERHGRTLWQIGTFDRAAGEFRNGDDARQYQMFTLYPKQFPQDVNFTIGKSDIKKDWNYAQWSWYVKDPAWRVKFDLSADQKTSTGTATLTLAFASAQPARGPQTDLRVAVNGKELSAIHLPKTGTAGYRGGVQDSPYNVKTIPFEASLLHPGTNELTLRHADAQPFPAQVQAQNDNEETPVGTGGPGQVMYDAIRLEVQP